MGELLFSDSYVAFPRQKQFHRSRAKYRLFGGAAGPGKTKALLWEAIGQANEVAGCDTLLLRPHVSRTGIVAALLLPAGRASLDVQELQRSKHVVTWKNGSTTRFGLLPQRERCLPVSRRGVSVHPASMSSRTLR